MNRQDLNTVLAFLLPIVTGFIVWMIQRRITSNALAKLADEKEKREAIARGHQALLDRVAELERVGAADSQSLALLKQEMLPMAEAMKRKLVDILTHPSDEFKIPDALLAKVKVVGAALPEELEPWLEERAHSTSPHVTEEEKLAAEALPIIVKLAALEAQDADSLTITGVQLVSSTSKSKETKRREEGKAQGPVESDAGVPPKG